MVRKTLLLGGAVIGAVAMSVPASAAPFLFQLTGSKTATFTIDSSFAPDLVSSNAFGDQISYNTVNGMFGGTTGSAAIGFGTNIYAQLNVTGTSLGFTQFAGPNLFTLVNAKPVFNVGTFALTSIVSGASTLRISAVAAVPEPASWAMMIVGLGAVGFAVRRRQKVIARVSYAG